MKLSVFVVTYNQEQYISQCLDGIAAQRTDFDFEVIIGDDCSTDSTGAICDEYAARYANFHVFHHENNIGHVRNWEFVLQHCKGEYVAMVEGDDYWTAPHKLQTQVDFLDRHKDFAISFHKVELVYEHHPHIEEHLFEHLQEREYSTREVYETWSILTSSVVFRNNIGNISFPRNIFFSDIYLFLSLLEHGRAWCHNMCAVAYRRHSDNQSSSPSIQLAERLYLQYGVMEKRFPLLYDISHKTRQQYLHEIAYNYTHEPSAVRYMLKYMSQHPSKIISPKYWRRLFTNLF